MMLIQDEDEEHVAPVLGRKYTAPLNILNDLSKDERVGTHLLRFYFELYAYKIVLNDVSEIW